MRKRWPGWRLGTAGLMLGLAAAVAPEPVAASAAAPAAGATPAATVPTLPARAGGIAEIDSLITAARGRWVLVNVWATWCRPCVAETPDLVALAHSLPAERFVLLGLSTDRMVAASDSAAVALVEAFRQRTHADYPQVVYTGGNDPLTERFELEGAIPATILYDPAGQEAARWEKRLAKADLARIRKLVR